MWPAAADHRHGRGRAGADRASPAPCAEAKFRAWLLATVLTAAAVGLHLLKGLDVEEATLCAALFVLLVSARKGVHRQARPRVAAPGLGTVIVVGVALATGLGWAWLSIDADGEASGHHRLATGSPRRSSG